MKMKIKEIFAGDFRRDYLISVIIVSLGSFLIYARQHNQFTFNIIEFLVWLPFTWMLLFTMAISMVLFLNKRE